MYILKILFFFPHLSLFWNLCYFHLTFLSWSSKQEIRVLMPCHFFLREYHWALEYYLLLFWNSPLICPNISIFYINSLSLVVQYRAISWIHWRWYSLHYIILLYCLFEGISVGQVKKICTYIITFIERLLCFKGLYNILWVNHNLTISLLPYCCFPNINNTAMDIITLVIKSAWENPHEVCFLLLGTLGIHVHFLS